MQCEKIQREVVTPSAAAIRKSNRQIVTTVPDGGDHDKSDFASLVTTNLAVELDKTFSNFISSRVVTPAFGGEPREFDGFANDSGRLARKRRKAVMISSQFSFGCKPKICRARFAIDFNLEREFAHRISNCGDSMAKFGANHPPINIGGKKATTEHSLVVSPNLVVFRRERRVCA